MTPAAFPELGFLPSQVREFVLWHRRGQMGLEGSMQGPLERLVVQGQDGTSLFILVEGAVEVLLRREDGKDWPLDTRLKGAVLGEMSLLTGESRAATVRAVTGATVYEIGKRQ